MLCRTAPAPPAARPRAQQPWRPAARSVRAAVARPRPPRPPAAGDADGAPPVASTSWVLLSKAAQADGGGASAAEAAAGAAAPAPAAATAALVAPSSAAAFAWERAWYPVAVAADLEADRPHAVALLGRELVLWRDAAGAWRCFEDRCPHRAAPLSQGRLERGALQCNYHGAAGGGRRSPAAGPAPPHAPAAPLLESAHSNARSPPRPVRSLPSLPLPLPPPGWTFGPDGRCTGVPQSSTPERICGLQASAAAAHPCTERQGLIWVWPAAGPAAAADAAATPPATVPELDAGWWLRASWLQRDIPVSMELIMVRLRGFCF